MDFGIPQRRKRLWIVGVNDNAAKSTLVLAVPTAEISRGVCEIEIESKESSSGLLRWKVPKRWNWASSWGGQCKTCLVIVHFACQFSSPLIFLSPKNPNSFQHPEGRIRRWNFQQVTLERSGCDLASSPWWKVGMMLKKPGSLIWTSTNDDKGPHKNDWMIKYSCRGCRLNDPVKATK